MMRKLLLLLILLCFATEMSAQESKASTPGIMEANAYLAYLRAGEQTSRTTSSSSFSQAKSVEDLLHKVQPSQYLAQGVVNTYGEKPKHLFIDIASLNGLSNPALLKNNIDIVTIRINSAAQMGTTIDLSAFASFKSLKYVHIVSTVPATASAFANMVIHPEDRLSVFYSVETAEGNQ